MNFMATIALILSGGAAQPKAEPRRLFLSAGRQAGPFLDTREIVVGTRFDGQHALKPPEPVEPASWACRVAGLAQAWSDALILQDFTSAGKLRPWELRREQTIGVVAAYRDLAGRPGEHGKEFARIGGLMEHCGTMLNFACATDMQTEDQQRRLLTANFCRGRLCPMCNWRRSQKLGNELAQVVEVYRKEHPKSAMLMLTLTERNVSAADLGEAVDKMSKAFSKLRKRTEWLGAVRASFRSVEVTCPQPGEFHPHVHVLLLVDENYFSKAHDLYVEQATWARMWRECRGLDYQPVVDVRRVRRVSEVAKYVTKSADYLHDDGDGWSADADTIGALHVALKNRRLIAWSKELQEIRRELGCSDDDMAEDSTGFPPEYVITHREVYRWCPVTSRRGMFVRMKILPPQEPADDAQHEDGG